MRRSSSYMYKVKYILLFQRVQNRTQCIHTVRHRMDIWIALDRYIRSRSNEFECIFCPSQHFISVHVVNVVQCIHMESRIMRSLNFPMTVIIFLFTLYNYLYRSARVSRIEKFQLYFVGIEYIEISFTHTCAYKYKCILS